MRPGELQRVRFVFGLLGAVPVFLAGWFGWLQVVQAGELQRAGRSPLRLLPETADRQAWHTEVLPAPRGTILDRNGRVLALDCEAYEVRARVAPRGKDVATCGQWLDRFAVDVASCLVADGDPSTRAERYRRHHERLGRTLAAEFHRPQWPTSGELPEPMRRPQDLLIASGVDVLAVVEGLRALPKRTEYKAVEMNFLRTFERTYPDRDLTHGLIGHCDTAWVESPTGSHKVLRTFGVCGLETLGVLEPDAKSERSFLADGLGRPYFVAPVDDMPHPNVLHSTMDIDLQRVAMRELRAEAEGLEAKGTPPKWGSLVLIEINTGDVLAAASWHRGDQLPEQESFTPFQSKFEPGSIVKPLVLAYALEVGALDWSHVYDCAQGSATYRERIGKLGRRHPVTDDHSCGELTPHGIIVNSSNIGAAYIGLGLEREQWRDYMRFYGFGESLNLQIPHEVKGGTNRHSFDADIPLRSFQANSAISFSFGYELSATAMQISRAYLRLFRGGHAQLRICRGADVDGQYVPAPSVADTGPRMRAEVVDAVRAAMVDVVSDEPHATGFRLHEQVLKDLGIDLHGLIAGKTGTAASTVGVKGGGSISARNASFVGLLPAEAPRWLAVCVMQKDDSAKFYGGSYAAPPVVRLLLQCMQLEQRRQLRQDSPTASDGQIQAVLGTPGDSGWGK